MYYLHFLFCIYGMSSSTVIHQPLPVLSTASLSRRILNIGQYNLPGINDNRRAIIKRDWLTRYRNRTWFILRVMDGQLRSSGSALVFLRHLYQCKACNICTQSVLDLASNVEVQLFDADTVAMDLWLSIHLRKFNLAISVAIHGIGFLVTMVMQIPIREILS